MFQKLIIRQIFHNCAPIEVFNDLLITDFLNRFCQSFFSPTNLPGGLTDSFVIHRRRHKESVRRTHAAAQQNTAS
jgi:hypothetical protein